MTIRQDHRLIVNWVNPQSRVLDLGCGSGLLLKTLASEKQAFGYGLELNPEKIQTCIENGVNVIEHDIDSGLSKFPDQSYDYVIISLALQALKRPNETLDEMLRVGREVIISFPNFAHFRTRAYLALKGKMPVSKSLPYEWYETPNIHLCTIRDFEELCQSKGYRIVDRQLMNSEGQTLHSIWPNLFASTAFYKITRDV